MRCIDESTSNLPGSDGHRRLLHREGIAYTLRFGPPLIFVTPKLADTKNPLLLIVQGEEFRMHDECRMQFKEMAERLAADPVGQSIVFDLMIRLFFTVALGVAADAVVAGQPLSDRQLSSL